MSEYVITINSTSDLPKEWVWEREIPGSPAELYDRWKDLP